MSQDGIVRIGMAGMTGAAVREGNLLSMPEQVRVPPSATPNPETIQLAGPSSTSRPPAADVYGDESRGYSRCWPARISMRW